MANTTMDVLYPEFWEAAFDELDMGEYQLPTLVSRKVENIVANRGDTVNVPITPDLGDAEDWTPGSTINATNIAQETRPVVLNKSKRKTICLNGTELSLSPYDLISQYGVPMARSIIRAVNLDIYLELLKTDQWVDARAGVNEDFLVDAGTKLSQNEVSRAGRVMVLSPEMNGALQKLDAFQHVDTSGSSEVMLDGRIVRKLGFDFYENHIIDKYTPADTSGAVNLSAGYAAGATSILVDGLNDDAAPIRPGDMFTIADEVNTPLHTVISTVKTNGDTTAITFLPALTDAVTNDAVVTIIPTQSLVGFVPSAVAFAARRYAELPGVGVKQSLVTVGNIPVRVSVWHDGKLGLQVQYDTLYGVKMINKNRVVRVLEDA